MGSRRTTVKGSGGTRLAVIDYGGEGPGILLVHGMMGRATTWDSTAAWLTGHGRVIGYDARGHGLSESPDGPYDRKAHLDDAAAVIDAFDLGPAIVIGHSMGGLTAWQLAGTRPELVRAIVIGDMAAVVPDVQDRWHAWLADWPAPFNSLAAVREYFAGDHFGKYLVGAHPERSHPHEGDYFIEVFTERPDGYHPLARTEHVLECREHWNDRDHSGELDAVTCPALVVAGQHSYFPVEGSREMADRLPDGRFVMIPNAGHVLHYDDPAAWRRAVEPFVAEVARR
ncbi:alpha/beta fold hydrolase [Micromonospora sp. HUAS LYJ1]|uniref:alpha/beta fold hydrolase n=1 Tax=Micromonospora sp. HUAS LYJ1 TaxID=3061626 RepID=UPI002672D761|nr:alpha/beta hydrolase [Micromonospora sp. HUAS LYJ1]WKU07122.1 alpha/beta hydrolase [Micromonospora sp. HUAS LYJ1]